MNKPSPEIEPNILPLVEAINSLQIVKTFSSCQGHFEPIDQGYMNRNLANVRFDPLPEVPDVTIEKFITYLMSEFNINHSFAPVVLRGYKLYTPNDDYIVDAVYVVELEPFNFMEEPSVKRKITDEAISHAVDIVHRYAKYKKMLM